MNKTLPVPANAAPGFNLEEMKNFVRKHFDDFVNRKMSDVALKNFSDDFLDHDEPGGAVVGPLAAKTMMENAYQIWPDLRVEVEDILAESDKVMVRNVWTATENPAARRFNFADSSCGDSPIVKLSNVGPRSRHLKR
jgi:predicted ester cyclase